MPIVRNKFFINIPYKILQLNSLSWAAKGFWCFLLSRSNDDLPLEALEGDKVELQNLLDELIKEGLVAYDKSADSYLSFWSTEECQEYKDQYHLD